MRMFLFLSLLTVRSVMANIHPGFVTLKEVCPNLNIYASYARLSNFTGEKVPGYKNISALMAKIPAEALCRIQKDAEEKGYGLKIFDSYRPLKAVAFFQEWAQRSESNPHLKEMYYPDFTRMELFENGYIAKQSSHSRGSAVDLTLVDLKTNEDLDMGTHFDFFGELSHTDSPKISSVQKNNRKILKDLMENRGFKNFSQEWWHYSFKPEPYPNEAFDFDVE